MRALAILSSLLILLFGLLWIWFVPSFSPPPEPHSTEYFSYSASGLPYFSVVGYETLCRLELFRTDPVRKSWSLKGKTPMELSFDTSNGILELRWQGKNHRQSIEPLVKRLSDYRKTSFAPAHSIPQEKLTWEWQSEGLHAKWVIYNLSGRPLRNGIQIDHLKSDLLLSTDSKIAR